MRSSDKTQKDTVNITALANYPVFQFFRVLFRFLSTLIILAVFLVGVGILAARYWVLPHIEQWRPQIAHYLSAQLDLHIDLGAVTADWKGINPRIALRDVSISSPGGRTLLVLPRINAELGWRSFITLRPTFEYLEASGLEVSARRDAQGQLRLLGRTLDLGQGNDDDGSGRLLRWLAQQKRIVLHDATLKWSDDTRTGEMLTLDGVSLRFTGRGSEYRFALSATPPAKLGRLLDVRGVFQAPEEGLAVPDVTAESYFMRAYRGLASWLTIRLAPMSDGTSATAAGEGALYIHIDEMQTLGWTPWMDLPTGLVSGRVSSRSRIDFLGGHPEIFTSEVQVEQGVWDYSVPVPAHDDHDKPSERGLLQIKADTLQLYLHGSLDAYRRMLVADSTKTQPPAFTVDLPPDLLQTVMTAPSAVDYRVISTGVKIEAQNIMPTPIAIDHLVLKGALSMPAGEALHVAADFARISNRDIDATLHGSWRPGGSSAAGVIDLSGHIQRARIAAIRDYLPLVLDAEVHKWMAHGLQAGEIHNASLLLKGDLIHFPFGNDQVAFGDFRVEGPYRGAVIDYLPPENGKPGWPALVDMQGRASMRRTRLHVTADTARVQPAKGKWVDLTQVNALIPDLGHDPVLTVTGDTRGDGAAYLALMTHSPLGNLLHHTFDDTRAEGSWQVPLSLNIPLTHGADTTVLGEVQFDGGTLRLMPDMPEFGRVEGALAFTESGAVARGLHGEFLGGLMKLDGGIGQDHKGLRMTGIVKAAELIKFAGAPALGERLQGQVPYDVMINTPSAKGYTVVMQSSLVGLAIDAPAPLGKQATAKRMLRAQWRHDAKNQSARLDIKLGEQINAVLLQQDAAGHPAGGGEGHADSSARPLFHAGAVGVNQEPVVPSAGMRVDVSYPAVDLDAWYALIQRADSASGKKPFFPPLERLRLQTDKAQMRGLDLDKLTFTIQQAKPSLWRADVSSTQTAGSLSWRYANGKIDGPVQVRFDRLAIGQPQAEEEKTADSAASAVNGHVANDDINGIDDDLDVPAINLYVRNLSLYGRPAGELALTGFSQEKGRLWRLEQVRLSTPAASLEGKGMWRLSGPQRGLTLDAKATVKDLGAYLEHAQFNDLMSGGSGQLTASLVWRNMPWAFNRADLSGAISFDLKKGRFSGVNSPSARLLELLSLQSFRRLARLDVNPASVAGDGFPFNTLKGTLNIKHGVVHTHDYRVVGPAGTVVLEGTANLVSNTLDMQAAVVPNLDVSGAAIAAGIALNPIVGVGAFLTQLLLQTPLEKAMAARYQITGNLAEPTISEMATTTHERAKPARPEPEH